MKKIIIGLSLVVLLLVSIAGSTNATGGSVSLQTGKSEFSKNEEFVVNATISGITTTQGIGVIMATLEYSEDSLQLERIDGQNGWDTSSYNKGILIADKNSDITNNEVIFRITFKVKENANPNFYVALKEITVSEGIKDIELANTVRNFTIKKEPDISDGNGDNNNQDNDNNNDNNNVENNNGNNDQNNNNGNNNQNNNNNNNNGNNNQNNNNSNNNNAGNNVNTNTNNKPNTGTNTNNNTSNNNKKPNNGNNIVNSDNNEINNDVNEIENNLNENLENNTVNENVENTLQNKVNNTLVSNNNQETDYSKIFIVTLSISVIAVIIALIYSGIKTEKKKKNRSNYYSSNINYNDVNEFDTGNELNNMDINNYSEDVNGFDTNTLNNNESIEEFSNTNANSYSESSDNGFSNINNSNFNNFNNNDNQ